MEEQNPIEEAISEAAALEYYLFKKIKVNHDSVGPDTVTYTIRKMTLEEAEFYKRYVYYRRLDEVSHLCINDWNLVVGLINCRHEEYIMGITTGSIFFFLLGVVCFIILSIFS